jgi:hypothetical protein
LINLVGIIVRSDELEHEEAEERSGYHSLFDPAATIKFSCEIDPTSITLGAIIGQGTCGSVRKAQWRSPGGGGGGGGGGAGAPHGNVNVAVKALRLGSE